MCDAPSWPSLGRHNARLKFVKTLRQRKHREREGLVVLEGQRLVLDALELGLKPELLLFAEELAASDGECGGLRAAAAGLDEGSVACVPMSVLEGLCDTQNPQGVLATLAQPQLALPPRPSLVLCLDRIGDPGNMGTLLRSAVGAGAHAALLLPGCSDPWGAKALRAGMGAQLRLPLRAAASWEDAARQLDEWGCAAVAADARGACAHHEVDWARPSALVVGSEAHGLAEEIASDARTTLCRIPMQGGIESLNAAMAGAVMLFEAQRQRAAGADASGVQGITSG